MKRSVNLMIVNAAACLFIILFVYAALSKIIDFQKFHVQLGKSPILAGFSGIVAWLVPSVELAIAGLLSFQRTQLIALFASFSLMVMFSAYIVVILNFSSYIPCSCGGILEHMSWTQHLWFNVAFVALGATAVLLYPNKQEIIAR